jgi:hypothetical protein
MITTNMILSILVAAGPYAFVCVAVALCFYRHRASARESMRKLETVAQRARSAEQRLGAVETALSQIQAQMRDLDEQARLSSGAPAKSWTNINRRTQAVRMLRAGDKPAHVAAELSMSRAEVELIRRVHSLTAHTYEPVGLPAAKSETSIFSVGD